jgi:hypothetical protein
VNLRATLALALVALALGAYVYLFERGTSREEEAERARKVVLQLDRDAISQLELPTEGGETAKLARDPEVPGSWRLERPIPFPADEGTVERLLSALEKLEADGIIEERTEDPEPFGLGSGALRLRIVREEGEPIELEIGGETPVGSSRYLARADVPDRLYTLPQWKVDSLVPSIRDLRDKRITRLESEDVTALRVWRDGALVVAAERVENEAEGSTWEIGEPFAARADGERIRRLVQDFVFGRVSGFVDDPGPLGDYGLAPPEIVLELSAGDARERIELGRAEEKVYARVFEPALVVEVPKRLFGEVPEELFGYRYKQVLSVSDEDVERMELQFPRDDAAFGFIREEGRWTPEDPETRVDSLKLSDLVWAIRDLEAIGVVEASFDPARLGLDPPRVRVLLRDGEGGEIATLELGSPQFPDGLAARSTQGESIWRVDNDLGTDVPLGLEVFRNRWLEPEAEEISEAPAGEADPAAEQSEATAADD